MTDAHALTVGWLHRLPPCLCSTSETVIAPCRTACSMGRHGPCAAPQRKALTSNRAALLSAISSSRAPPAFHGGARTRPCVSPLFAATAGAPTGGRARVTCTSTTLTWMPIRNTLRRSPWWLRWMATPGHFGRCFSSPPSPTRASPSTSGRESGLQRISHVRRGLNALSGPLRSARCSLTCWVV